MEYPHLFRIFVVFVIIVAWYTLSERTGQRWNNMTRVGKRLWVWYYAVLGAIAYGTIESFKDNSPLTSKNYVLAVTLVGLTVAALLRLKGDESTDPVYKFHLEGKITKWRIEKLR